jgi:homoserine O-acetyltransferase/O-succinyltransferase
MSGSVTLAEGAELCHLPATFALDCGRRLAGGVLAFERQGPEGAPVIAVLGGISAGRHPSAHAGVAGPGWWEGCVGQGQGVDTQRFQVLSFDWIGGAGSSSGPDACGPDASVSTADQARALAALLDQLGIPRLHALVGASYGGMVGLQFAALFPSRIERLCVLAAAHEADPMSTAFRCVQRAILALGRDSGREREGVALARALAMATYRGRPEFAARFAAAALPPGTGPWSAVHDYLLARGEEFAQHFSSAAFALLSASIDQHRVDPARVHAPVWLVGFDTDQIVPPEQLLGLAQRLPALVQSRVLRSRFGHDGFLKETAQLRPLLREALR